MQCSWPEDRLRRRIPTTALSTLEAKLLAGDVSKQTHDSIIAQIEAPSKNAVADSPEQKQDQKAVRAILQARRTPARSPDCC